MLRDGGLEPDCSSRMHEPNHIANPIKDTAITLLAVGIKPNPCLFIFLLLLLCAGRFQEESTTNSDALRESVHHSGLPPRVKKRK